MKVYMLWHGGSSYAVSGVEHVEECDSIAQAVRIFDARRGDFDGRTPCVDEGASAFLYYTDPRGKMDAYPDRVIVVGARGGVRLGPC